MAGRPPGLTDRRADVLLAAALLANRPGTRAGSALAEADEVLLLSLRSVAGRTDEPLVRVNLLRWLASPQLGAQARRRMHEALGELPDLLGGGHLLLAPARRLALRHVERPARCVPPVEAAIALPPSLQVNAVRLVSCLPAPAAVRRTWLAGCASMTSPVAKLVVVRALCGIGRPRPAGDGSSLDDESLQALASLCFDPAEAVAMAAYRALAGAGKGAAAGALERIPHRSLARRTARRIACGDVNAFLERLLDLDRADRVAAARKLLAAAPQRLAAGLARAVSAGSRASRLEAMAVARRIGMTARIEPALIGQTQDGDARVAASAIAALGDAGPAAGEPSLRRIKAVEAGLDHPDDRVKANAVEGLMRISRRKAEHLEGPLSSRDNRLRGNAVLALLRVHRGRGAGALAEMLSDVDPLHRTSAVWVAQRARAAAAFSDLENLAAGDRFPEIRTRAAAAARVIEHACRGPH